MQHSDTDRWRQRFIRDRCGPNVADVDELLDPGDLNPGNERQPEHVRVDDGHHQSWGCSVNVERFRQLWNLPTCCRNADGLFLLHHQHRTQYVYWRCPQDLSRWLSEPHRISNEWAGHL